ncbi:MAG: UDP-4-amino-4,6-dideoxy-N-acetyl-beta-L-altrosamine transaminase [Hoeflea sp.]|uniref:UDP-4-amino-4, 6-dideoxy-N-acetyl-beta-L-altrosamine transaminase n=1 Tax=Hoeflea sp. TaxID=1940281 RepID=UPI0032972C89
MPRRFIGYGRQSIEQGDIDAVVNCLTGDYLTQGPAIEAFESSVCEYLGARHAVAVSSGTAALHVAAMAAGAAPGVIGVTQTMTFVASANSLAYCGADVCLTDIDPDTMSMSPEALSNHLDRYPQTRIIIPVSMTGLSSNGDALRDVAGRERIIIEDASHSLGADREDGTKIGAPGYADMTVFSFHPVKPITTGEGGIVVTEDDELARRLRLLRSHGIERDPDALRPGHKGEPWYYEQQELGLNYRLSDIQAALGTAQMGRLDNFIARRRAIAEQYDRRLSGLPHIRRCGADAGQRARSGHHLYVIGVDFAAVGKSRSEVMNLLRHHDIGSQVHYIPVHRQPWWEHRFLNRTDTFPAAESYYEECLSIPCFPGMSDDEVDHVIETLDGIVNERI